MWEMQLLRDWRILGLLLWSVAGGDIVPSFAQSKAPVLAVPLLTEARPEASTGRRNAKLDWNWRYVKVAVGAEYFSNLSGYGATFYDSFQVVPIVAVDLFHPNLQLIGTSPRFQWPVGDSLLFRSHINLGTPGDSPLYTTGEETTNRNERDAGVSFSQFVEIGKPEYGEFRIEYEQFVGGSQGSYFDFRLRVPVHNFYWKSTILQPSLFASFGVGSADFNSYIYGDGAANDFSVNNFSVGVELTIPSHIDHFYPALRMKYYEVLGDNNRNASLVSGDSNGFQIIAIVAFEIFRTGAK